MKYMKNVPVVGHTQISHDTYKLVIQDAQMAAVTMPGQFAQLKPSGALAPLLRRPISVADVDAAAQTITFIYRVIGDGTKVLTALEAGQSLDIIGPLGKGFSLNAKKALLVGGGVGIAPLIYLSRALCGGNNQVLLAGRNSRELFWQSEFKNSCEKIHITTDDGSLGVKGNALALLPELLASGEYDFVYTCGPIPMMQGVAKLAEQHGIACEVSLEKYMACGLGACLSCSCAGKSGKRVKVCTDGPVFPSTEVIEWH